MENRRIGTACGTCGHFTPAANEIDFCRGCRSLFVRGAPHAVVSIRATMNGCAIGIATTVDYVGEWSVEMRDRIESAIEGVEATRRARDAGEL